MQRLKEVQTSKVSEETPFLKYDIIKTVNRNLWNAKNVNQVMEN